MERRQKQHLLQGDGTVCYSPASFSVVFIKPCFWLCSCPLSLFWITFDYSLSTYKEKVIIDLIYKTHYYLLLHKTDFISFLTYKFSFRCVCMCVRAVHAHEYEVCMLMDIHEVRGECFPLSFSILLPWDRHSLEGLCFWLGWLASSWNLPFLYTVISRFWHGG